MYLGFSNGSSEATIFISEATENGTSVFFLTITDPDLDTNLNLGILNGNIRNAFTFTLLSTNTDDTTRTEYNATGELKVVAPLDYESRQNYTLVLFASDTKSYATFNVMVYLIPENTKAPSFDVMPGFGSYQYRATENTAYTTLNGPFVS